MTDLYMKKCINEALKSGGDIPVGCAIVKDGNIVALSHNEKEVLNSVSAHAEILALNKAAQYLGNWRLSECDLYVTLEPCVLLSNIIIFLFF